jgi:hypothetical protein
LLSAQLELIGISRLATAGRAPSFPSEIGEKGERHVRGCEAHGDFQLGKVNEVLGLVKSDVRRAPRLAK